MTSKEDLRTLALCLDQLPLGPSYSSPGHTTCLGSLLVVLGGDGLELLHSIFVSRGEARL